MCVFSDPGLLLVHHLDRVVCLWCVCVCACGEVFCVFPRLSTPLCAKCQLFTLAFLTASLLSC